MSNVPTVDDRLWQTLRSANRLVWSSARAEFSLMVGTQLVGAVGLVIQLYLARELLVNVTSEGAEGSFGSIAPTLIFLTLTRIVVSLASEIRREVRLVAFDRVTAAAATELYTVSVAVELGAFDDADFHDRLRRAYLNVDRRIWSAVWALVSLTSGLSTLVVLTLVLITTAPLVLVFSSAAALPLWWVRRKNNQALYRFAYEQTTADRERSYVESLLVSRDAAAEIRSLEIGSTLIDRVHNLYQDRIHRTRDLVKSRLPWSALATIVSNLIAIGSVALLAGLIIRGDISIADGGVAIIALQQAASRFASMSEAIGSLSGAALFLDDYETFVRDGREATSSPNSALKSVPGSFVTATMSGVTFTYPGMNEPALHDVSMRVGKGELVALVGVNGSGKTTAAKLLSGLYPPDSGTVTWHTDKTAVNDREQIRPMVGNVFQHYLRFELSVRDNVAFGDTRRRENDDSAVWNAIRATGLDETIQSHPRGLSSRLGRSFVDGQDLSAGQWQRISIARAFYRNAPLLILDEPTAAVDAEAEADVFEVIRELQRDRAVVLITHRMATVREADRIYVLDNGRVSEEGTHDELVARRGIYFDLYRLQASSYTDTP